MMTISPLAYDQFVGIAFKYHTHSCLTIYNVVLIGRLSDENLSEDKTITLINLNININIVIGCVS